MSLEQQMDTAEKALGHVVQVRLVCLFTPRKVLAGKPKKCLKTLSRKCMVGRTSFCFMLQRCLTVCFLLKEGEHRLLWPPREGAVLTGCQGWSAGAEGRAVGRSSCLHDAYLVDK